MNHSLTTMPDHLRANPERRPKAGSFVNGVIAYSPRFYAKTIGLLNGIPINTQPCPRKAEPKRCNH